MNTKRIKYLDLAKAFAILLVIVGHSYWIKDLKILFLTIYSFHVPLFFIISGYFVKDMPLSTAFLKNSKAYLRPLVVTALIALLLVAVGDFVWNRPVLTTVKTWAGLMLTMTGEQEAMGITKITALWFLMALFWGHLFFTQILKLKNTDQAAVVLCGIVFVTLLDKFYHLPLMIEEGVLATFFLWIGMNFNKLEYLSPGRFTKIGWISFLIIWLLAIPCGPFFFKTISYGRLWVTIIGSISASLIILKICSLFENYFDGGWIGRNTLNILCGHVISFNFLKLIGFQWEKINTPPIFLRFVIEILVMISLAMIIGWGLSHIIPFKKTIK